MIDQLELIGMQASLKEDSLEEEEVEDRFDLVFMNSYININKSQTLVTNII